MGSLGGSGGIFISYRREETAAQAGRLYDHLSNRFGEDRVFMDIDSIAIGSDFTKAVIDAVSGCNILLALIGPSWSAITDTKGIRRIDYPQDFVRVEIETALQRDIRIIPVLVDGAVLPQSADLPSSLRPLILRQALEISHTSFRSQMSRLIAAVDDVFEVGLGQPGEAKAIDRLSQRAGETHWSFRPQRQFLEPVAAVLSPQERVLGVCKLAFTWVIDCCLTVTNRNLYLSTDKNNGHWIGLCEQTPARFRVNERVLKIPLTTVEACAINNNVFTLQIRDEPAITFNHFPRTARNANTWVQKFMELGRSAEAPRTSSRATVAQQGRWKLELADRSFNKLTFRLSSGGEVHYITYNYGLRTPGLETITVDGKKAISKYTIAGEYPLSALASEVGSDVTITVRARVNFARAPKSIILKVGDQILTYES
jgi:hypothetical protein